MPTFSHFYVMTETGTRIYSKSIDTKVDEHLIPGFMTAMDLFAKKMLSGDLESLIIGRSKYFTSSAHGLLFIARTEPSANDKAMRKELLELQRIFFSSFPPDSFSSKWDNMKDIARTLDQLYDRHFKESDQKMREAIW